MIGQPCLSALGLAADPVAHDVSLIGVALQLNCFQIVEGASPASRYTGIRRNGFNSEIQLVQLWELRDVKSGAVCCTPWSADRCNVIVRDRVDIQGCIASYKGKTVREIEVAE